MQDQGGAATSVADAVRRQRNARGEGSRLADDIVTAALAIVEREGSDEAVTLRAVAREVGIAAPSIYAHFDGRQAVMLAVVVRVFDELAEAIAGAIDAAPDDPAARLLAGCAAYVDFGLGRPGAYSVLFCPSDEYHLHDEEQEMAVGPDGRPQLEVGGEAFDLVVSGIEACVAAGRSSSDDVVGDALALWVALHGMVTLWSSLDRFPWPERGPFLANLVTRLAELIPG